MLEMVSLQAHVTILMHITVLVLELRALHPECF